MMDKLITNMNKIIIQGTWSAVTTKSCRLMTSTRASDPLHKEGIVSTKAGVADFTNVSAMVTN